MTLASKTTHQLPSQKPGWQDRAWLLVWGNKSSTKNCCSQICLNYKTWSKWTENCQRPNAQPDPKSGLPWLSIALDISDDRTCKYKAISATEKKHWELGLRCSVSTRKESQDFLQHPFDTHKPIFTLPSATPRLGTLEPSRQLRRAGHGRSQGPPWDPRPWNGWRVSSWEIVCSFLTVLKCFKDIHSASMFSS